MVQLTNENINRKVDSLGRISVPSGLRSRFGIEPGDELAFGTLNLDGVVYITMTGAEVEKKTDYARAARVLIELGCEIPEKLEEML